MAPKGFAGPRVPAMGMVETDPETQRLALLAVCRGYERRGVDDPQGLADTICALGLGKLADEMVARKRRKDRRRRKAG